MQNANNLLELHLDYNNIQSEGFNVLFRALRDSPIEMLRCSRCDIKSIEIDKNDVPNNLRFLSLSRNSINADGCREISKLLQGGDSTLTALSLVDNKIDDERVAILVDALQSNKSLKYLDLGGNDGISNQGQLMLLKLVNDISSIKATLQSNHTLIGLSLKNIDGTDRDDIQLQIDIAVAINRYDPGNAGRVKVIHTQLNSVKRAELAGLQGVNGSVNSEINPLHLPEVLSLVGRHHGQGELYAALSSSIMTLFSTVNREKCIQQKRDYHASILAMHVSIVAEQRAKIEELDDELRIIEAAEEGNEHDNESEHCSNKRRRK